MTTQIIIIILTHVIIFIYSLKYESMKLYDAIYWTLIVSPVLLTIVGSSLLAHRVGLNFPTLFNQIFGIEAIFGSIVLFLTTLKSLYAIKKTQEISQINITLVIPIILLTGTIMAYYLSFR